jgi:ribose 1,5-bisphosphokinase
VVLITAPPEILAARLAARARGSDGPVENRLRRSGGDFVAELVINNVGAPDGNVGKLLDLLRSP